MSAELEHEAGIDRAGAAAAAGAAVLYGSSYVATAFALRSFTPLGAAATRGALGTIALAVVVAVVHPALPRRPFTASFLRLGLLGILGGPAFIVSMNIAVSLSGATVTAFVAGLYAVLAAVIAIPVLGERLRPRTVAALLLALVGTGLLADLHLEGFAAVGVAVGLLAAVLFGLFLVLSRRWSLRYGLEGTTVGIATLGLTAVVVGAALPMLSIPTMDAGPRLDAWLAVVWLALGPGALAAVMVVIGMRRLPARVASAFLLFNPPTAAVLAWLLLGERLSVLQLIGAAMVLSAIGMANVANRGRVPGTTIGTEAG